MNVKTIYEKPETERLIVEMEASFCTGSGDNSTSENGSGSDVDIEGGQTDGGEIAEGDWSGSWE